MDRLAQTPYGACSEAARAALAARAVALRLAPGEELFRDGSPADSLAFVLEGQVDILKEDTEGQPHLLATREAPTTLGIAALASGSRRTASVVARTPVAVLTLSRQDLRELDAQYPELARCTFELLGQSITLLQQTSQEQVEALAELRRSKEVQRMMGTLLVLTMLGFTAFTCVMVFSAHLVALFGNTSYVTVPVLIVTGTLVTGYVWSTGLPPSFWGLRLGDWRRDLPAALLATLPLMAGAVALKLWLVREHPGTPVFEVLDPATPFGPLWMLLIYIAFSPVQEFIIRGVVQSALSHFLWGRWGPWVAIVSANAVFLAAHVYTSIMLAAIATGCGMVWGWLYMRQRSLLGVSISHALLGIWAFFVVGLRGLP